MRAVGIAMGILLVSSTAWAIDADPSSYEALLPTLMPGDTLNLAPGTYTGGLDITGLAGTDAAWITITGPISGPAAVFEGNACCNTVEIIDSSYVAIQNITVDGKGIDGVFGVSAKNGAGNVVHHIAVEGCTFVGQGATQQTVGISTKTPTWGWIIRGNVIDGAGTGLYLGNSDFTQPFIAGVIENNLVKNTIGYSMQIKDQDPWPAHPGIPQGGTRTIIRNNVFLKNDQPSPDGARPNVFVGGPPPSGPGADTIVEIYGNVFVHNPAESLLQAAGRVTIHDNLFVDVADMAVNLSAHDGFPLLSAHVYGNTVYGAARAVHFSSASTEGDLVLANLLFAGSGIDGSPSGVSANFTVPVADAPMYVAAPSLVLGAMDFYPKPGKAEGPALDYAALSGETDYACDFNGQSKGDFTFVGAYAGAGRNPGWKPIDGVKPASAGCAGGTGGGSVGPGGTSSASGAGGGGASGANGASGPGAGAGAGTGVGAEAGDDGGCGCRTAGRAGSVGAAWIALAAGLGVLARRRRRPR